MLSLRRQATYVALSVVSAAVFTICKPTVIQPPGPISVFWSIAILHACAAFHPYLFLRLPRTWTRMEYCICVALATLWSAYILCLVNKGSDSEVEGRNFVEKVLLAWQIIHSAERYRYQNLYLQRKPPTHLDIEPEPLPFLDFSWRIPDTADAFPSFYLGIFRFAVLAASYIILLNFHFIDRGDGSPVEITYIQPLAMAPISAASELICFTIDQHLRLQRYTTKVQHQE